MEEWEAVRSRLAAAQGYRPPDLDPARRMHEGRFFPGALLLTDGTPVSGPAAQRHPLALLALLAAHAAPQLSRDTALALLWPERAERPGRHLLSEALYSLRKVLGKEAIRSAGDTLALDPELIWTDVAALRRASSTGDPAEVVALYRGPFMDGFHLNGAQAFDAWQSDRRRYFASLYEQSLYAQADAAEAVGDHRAAVHWLRLRLAQDPLSSHAAQRLMLALAKTGDRAAAILVARRHDALVREEVGIGAAPCVHELVRLLSADEVVDLATIPRCGAPGSGCAPEQPRYP